MKTLLKILNIFFVTLGIIFLIIIILIVYVFVADPFNLKPLFQTIKPPTSSENANKTPGTTDKHPLLDPEQEKTLETFGIDPAALPTEITPVMEKCFTSTLGAARVNEIKQGGEPTAMDFFKARSCLNN